MYSRIFREVAGQRLPRIQRQTQSPPREREEETPKRQRARALAVTRPIRFTHSDLDVSSSFLFFFSPYNPSQS